MASGLRRESAPDAILVAQVSHLKWNLLHPSRHLLHKYTLNVTLLAQVPDAGGAGLASAVAAKCL